MHAIDRNVIDQCWSVPAICLVTDHNNVRQSIIILRLRCCLRYKVVCKGAKSCCRAWVKEAPLLFRAHSSMTNFGS